MQSKYLLKFIVLADYIFTFCLVLYKIYILFSCHVNVVLLGH